MCIQYKWKLDWYLDNLFAAVKGIVVIDPSLIDVYSQFDHRVYDEYAKHGQALIWCPTAAEGATHSRERLTTDVKLLRQVEDVVGFANLDKMAQQNPATIEAGFVDRTRTRWRETVINFMVALIKRKMDPVPEKIKSAIKVLCHREFYVDHLFYQSYLAWNGGTVPKLAKAFNEGKGGLPVLADALEDAGCENAKVLGHLRECDRRFGEATWCHVADDILGIFPKEIPISTWFGEYKFALNLVGDMFMDYLCDS